MNPFHLLQIDPGAKDAEVRKAWLAAIRLHPPEREPERFGEIQAAYQLIKDEESRLRYLLFSKEAPGTDPMDVIFKNARIQSPKPLSYPAFQAFLKSLAK